MANHTKLEISDFNKVCYRPTDMAKEPLRKKVKEIKARKGRATINESLDEIILEWDKSKIFKK